jgi:methionyl-tRNA formyltransferase
MDNIIVATVKEWNIRNYFSLVEKYEGKFNFHLITNLDELKYEFIKDIDPKYIFFPHWSWIIPKDIYQNYECVVFHMTDLPFGRGGSPFQNLVMEEIYDTKVSALKVSEGLDAGDIYIKEPFNISIGSAEENFIKLSNIIFQNMIPKLLDNEITPIKQTGKVSTFKRRKPEQSNIGLLETKSILKLYDFIRMLDAEGYPKAYLELDGIRIEFSEVHLKSNKLVGRFEVTKK